MLVRRAVIAHRLNVIPRVVTRNIGVYPLRTLTPFRLNKYATVRHFTTDGKITIDEITKVLKTPKNPAFVPLQFRKFAVFVSAFFFFFGRHHQLLFTADVCSLSFVSVSLFIRCRSFRSNFFCLESFANFCEKLLPKFFFFKYFVFVLTQIIFFP